MRRTSDASMFMTDGEPNGETLAFAAKWLFHNHIQTVHYQFELFDFVQNYN